METKHTPEVTAEQKLRKFIIKNVVPGAGDVLEQLSTHQQTIAELENEVGILETMYKGCHMALEDFKKQNSELVDALKELVELKEMKTNIREHPLEFGDFQKEYDQRKPFAWEKAFELVSKHESTTK